MGLFDNSIAANNTIIKWDYNIKEKGLKIREKADYHDYCDKIEGQQRN